MALILTLILISHLTTQQTNHPTNRHPLKLAAPHVGPAFDDDFGLGVELNAVMALAVQVAQETLVPPLLVKVPTGLFGCD